MLIAVNQLKEKTLKVAIIMPATFPHAAKHNKYIMLPSRKTQLSFKVRRSSAPVRPQGLPEK